MTEVTRDVAVIAAILRRGGIVAYPTEAVFGLGCDPRNETAITKLLQLKQRDPAKGLILIAANAEQLDPWLQPLDATAQSRVQPTWPGPTTWVLPARAEVSPLLRGAHGTLAVRVTAHPVASALCLAFGGALVSTSANIAAEPPARDASTVLAIFGAALDGVLDGAVGGQLNPTEIRDGHTGSVLRPS